MLKFLLLNLFLQILAAIILYCSRDLPSVGHRWFEFNDTTVKPIPENQISKMFQGKQSAYMLFYRRKSLVRPKEGINGLKIIPIRTYYVF